MEVLTQGGKTGSEKIKQKKEFLDGQRKGEENEGDEKKEGGEGSVIISDDTNMTRCGEAVGETVKRVARIRIGAFQGQTVKPLLEMGKVK